MKVFFSKRLFLQILVASFWSAHSISFASGDCKESQSCLYQRANDLLILQANYLFSKSTQLFALSRQGSGGIYRELGKFCELDYSRSSSQAPSGNAALKRIPEKKCLENYLILAKKTLREVRSSIAKNEDSILRLASKNPAAIGGLSLNEPRVPSGPREVPQDWSESLSSQRPFIPDRVIMDPILKKLDDLQRTRGLTQTGRDNMDQELLAWWDAFPKCPDRDEFILVEMVERFPSQPTGEKLRRVKLKPDGKVEHDEKAYSIAMTDCQARRADWVKSAPLANVASSGAGGPAWLGKAPTSLSLEIFDQAQRRLADCVGAKAGAKSSPAPQKGGVTLCGSSTQQATPSSPAVGGSQRVRFKALQLADAEFIRAEQEMDRLLEQLR